YPHDEIAASEIRCAINDATSMRNALPCGSRLNEVCVPLAASPRSLLIRADTTRLAYNAATRGAPMPTKLDLARNWLPRYTGMPVDKFGDYILLTNFYNYLTKFAAQFNCEVYGEDRPMQAATNDAGLTIVKFGIGSPNAAIIMDLLTVRKPKG